MQMGGVGGLHGWRYIFIWEGVLTCLIALVGLYLIIDFPQKAHKSRGFLNDREIAYIITILDRDRRDVEEPAFSWKSFLRPALDLKVWAFGLIFL